jgi:hypothetical protein
LTQQHRHTLLGWAVACGNVFPLNFPMFVPSLSW